jgi:predicted HicB family RNase H-like nuclease
MTPRIQIVGRLPVDLSRRVRASAQQPHVSLNAFLIAALTRAVAAPRARRTKAGA